MVLPDILRKPELLEIARKVHVKLEEESREINKLKPLWLPAIDDNLLETHLASVAERVNNILDIYPPLPKIEYNYFSQKTVYKPKEKCISLCYEDMPYFEVDAAIAHEYCHHIQHHVSGNAPGWHYYRELKEGFARGIELIVARQIAKERDNLRFSESAVDHAESELEIFLKKYAEITNRKIMEDSGNAYILGVTAFLVAEYMHSDKIYKRLIKSTRPYRLLFGFLEGKVNP